MCGFAVFDTVALTRTLVPGHVVHRPPFASTSSPGKKGLLLGMDSQTESYTHTHMPQRLPCFIKHVIKIETQFDPSVVGGEDECIKISLFGPLNQTSLKTIVGDYEKTGRREKT